MAYDDRLSIRYEFEYNGKLLVNKLKLVEYDKFVQLWVNAGDKFASLRLDKKDCKNILNFLQNAVDNMQEGI